MLISARSVYDPHSPAIIVSSTVVSRHAVFQSQSASEAAKPSTSSLRDYLPAFQVSLHKQALVSAAWARRPGQPFSAASPARCTRR